MARLALVSRNPVMSMGLSALTHDIVEVRPNALDDWLDQGNDSDVDALVLDLGSPSVALRLVGDLRANGRWTPVLLVASDNTGWDSPDLLALPGVDVLALPLDSARLQKAATAVLRHPAAPPIPHRTSATSAVPEPLIDDVAEPFVVVEPSLLVDDGTPRRSRPDPLTDPLETPPLIASVPVAEVVPAAEAVPEPTSSPEPALAVQALVLPQPSPAPIPVRDVEPETDLKTEPATKPDKPKKTPRVARPKPTPTPDVEQKSKSGRRARGPKQTLSHPHRRATDRLGEQAPEGLVSGLLDLVDRLYTLGETADVIVEDAVSRSSADSGALLVPDGDTWRVAGGVGLRPLEYRYQLTADSWLVDRVGSSLKGILIEDSDVARRHLHGAPLASRTHLLVVPVATVSAILILSRDQDPPFSETVLADLAHLAEEAGPLLRRAIDIRTLSRALLRHADDTEIPHN